MNRKDLRHNDFKLVAMVYIKIHMHYSVEQNHSVKLFYDHPWHVVYAEGPATVESDSGTRLYIHFIISGVTDINMYLTNRTPLHFSLNCQQTRAV